MDIKHFFQDSLSPSQKSIIKAISLYFKGHTLDINPDESFKSEFKLDNQVLVGTHHKTGTVWLLSIFKKFCDHNSLKFYHSSEKSVPPKKCDIFLQERSAFDLQSMTSPFRGVHLIRDPRDVIVSGCFYHQKSGEAWLHTPRQEWNGLSYQQKINSYNNFDDKLIFEMENRGTTTINEMTNWDYESPYFYEVKYENLIVDYDLILFHQMFSFLGFPGFIIPKLLMIAYNNSLFSGQSLKSNHIRSGKAKQWQGYFKPIHTKRFIQLFGDCLVRLGYAENDNW